ncbi:RRP12-like protein isoform X1 [Bufo bufo]|uniref:RRP12-like protein isoform X1 n=1 Tax=Bufo bufo TaxID=8384 RepID=UPI001ABE6640|nr:RRP12-like protein isoform X1 [Bufo bufo]
MGKTGKLRSGTAGKVKRWKKGHSSESNPQAKRHREAARSRFFSRPSGKSDLTVDALKLHNDLQSGTFSIQKKPDEDMEEDAEMGVTEKSGATFLSGLSDCTNVTFGKVQRYWESNSAAHKEICAVLAAVTEVIRSQGGNETETEYFAALMTTLEAVESSESLAAVAYLLNLVMKRLPGPVLIKKFSDTSKALMDILASQTNTASVSVVRWIISCLAVLLRKQDLSVWSYPSTLQVYHGLLSFTVHAKPKIRKAAQLGVCSILKGSEFMFSDSAPAHHPAASSTAKFCIQEIEKSGGSKEATTTLHMLTLLKDVLPCFPVSLVKSCCETLLKVMTLSHVFITACAMQAFHALFSSKPSTQALTAELNAQIITALYDYLPNENDLQPLLAWLAVMEQAHVNLSRLQSDLCFGHLPRLFSTSMNCLLSPHKQVVSAAAGTLKSLLTECVAPHIAEIGTVSSSSVAGPAGHIYKMFKFVEDGLSYKFHASWAFVLQVIQTFFEVAGKFCHPIMKKCLQTLADLRISAHFPHTGELDRAVGAAVESMGPEVVLRAIPLQIDGTERDNPDFPRSWLVPMIRDYVKNTELDFFARYFLPLAEKLKKRASELAEAGRNLEAKIYETLQWQIWTMLPGFCIGPTDVAACFKNIAKTLGMIILDQPDRRLTACQALRTLINKGCEAEADKAEVSRLAKNYLPILFNVYIKAPAPGEGAAHKAPVMETIRAYLTVTDQQLVCDLLAKASAKVAEKTEAEKLYVLDLISAMAPNADEPSMTNVYQTILPLLEEKNHSMQKKAYRILEEICGGERSPCKDFVSNNLEELKTTLLGSLKSASSPAKRPRLKCLIHIVKQLTADHEEFLTSIIPEVMICTKEASVAARKNAYTLVAEIGHAFLRFFNDPKEALERYLAVVYAGLTGSVTMITCTVLALTRLVFEFKDHTGVAVIEQLLQNVCLLLSAKTREVVKAALGFIKVIIFTMDLKVLTRHLQMMIEAIGNINQDMRRHFRMKLKNIFTKFIRKFGFELVKDMLPADYHKVLANIRKAEAKNKKQKALKQAASKEDEDDEDGAKPKGNDIEDILADTDEEEEEEDKKRTKQQKKQVRQMSKAWLKEGEGDEPLNFLDANAAQRVLATKPGVKNSKKSHDFKVTSDGRLIIKDDEAEEKSKGVDEEMADLMEEVGLRTKKAQKKRFREDNDEDGETAEKTSQYKAGGTGIHRPLSKKPEFGRAYKSKKGKGDIKQKGKHDPYAYIPLNKSKLNRRKKAKMQGQFKGLVKAAQKGALSGKKKKNARRS